MKYLSIILIIAVSILLSSCLKDDKNPVYEDIDGAVSAPNGEGVPDADIHIRNNFKPGGFTQEASAENFIISFESPSDTIYTLNLYRLGAENPFATKFYPFSTGPKDLFIPDSLLSNGILEYEIKVGSTTLLNSLFLVNKPDSALIGTKPFTTTNSGGEFTLRANQLAFGESFQIISGEFKITDSLEIIVITNDSLITKKRVEVEPNEPNFFEITLD